MKTLNEYWNAMKQGKSLHAEIRIYYGDSLIAGFKSPMLAGPSIPQSLVRRADDYARTVTGSGTEVEMDALAEDVGREL